jgi:DNA repair photolyase
MADGSMRELQALIVGDELYGTERHGWYRRYTRTRVLAHWKTQKSAFRVTLADGTSLVASGDHRFLTERGWKHVTGSGAGQEQRPHLTTGNKLMGFGAAFAVSPVVTTDYKLGYLCGTIRGDGHIGFYPYNRAGRTHGHQYCFRLAMADHESLVRSSIYLAEFGIPTQSFKFQPASEARREMWAIRTSARAHFERIQSIIAWPTSPSDNWWRGFLAGIFDAEGSYSGGVLRIANTDQVILEFTARCLDRLGHSYVIETPERASRVKHIRVRGGLLTTLRLLQTVDSAILRKRSIEGQAVKSQADLRVLSVEPLDVELPMYDITTGTGDFIANGVVSHNCYARPTHEWLGFSSGLDFETRILVKEDAPRLLEKALAAPSWQPRTIALSGVTDPYQPVERKLQLTRRCLEVLVAWRNPVAIVTKNALVTRDCDLLAELARVNGAAVFVSVTTLDTHLARIMEPRASAPAQRLAAITLLTQAGIPVGVMVAPIIPGLTDHEIPAIISAATQAGARFAGHTIVRLPYSVKDLFGRWLETHYPERKNKVLNRVRAIRGGKLNNSQWHQRMRGEGVFADFIHTLFAAACRKAGLPTSGLSLSTAAFRRPDDERQLSLF